MGRQGRWRQGDSICAQIRCRRWPDTKSAKWGMSSGNTAHWQGQVTISDDSFSDIMEPNRALQSGYSLANMRAGVSNDNWVAEVYIDNLTDKRAEISNTFVFDRERIMIVRPRTLGLRLKYNF